jgi:hypothetical protein
MIKIIDDSSIDDLRAWAREESLNAEKAGKESKEQIPVLEQKLSQILNSGKSLPVGKVLS